MLVLEFVGIGALGLLLGLGAVAGAGGGTINVPVCLFLFRFTVKESTTFSNAAACILAFIKFIYGRKKRDPNKKNKTLIGNWLYDICLFYILLILFAKINKPQITRLK